MAMLMIFLLLVLCPNVRALPFLGSEEIAAPDNISPIFDWKRHEKIPAVSPNKVLDSPMARDDSASRAAYPHSPRVPSMPDSRHDVKKGGHSFGVSPSSAPNSLHHPKEKSSAPESSYQPHPLTYSQEGPLPSPLRSPSSSPSWISAAPSSSPRIPARQIRKPITSPAVSPFSSSLQNENYSSTPPPPRQVFSLPFPPLNEDCTSVVCTEPLTYALPGSPCGCVWPIQVRLSLDVELYTFFPLVSELANEIAASVSLFPHQVRTMGANAATTEPEKTVVLINLVPLGESFDSADAFSIYKKFKHKKVAILKELFGAYEVIYVRYPGLPSFPTSSSGNNGNTYDYPYPGNSNNGMAMKPLGVDVHGQQKRTGLRGNTVAIIALVSTIAFAACFGVVWLLLYRRRGCNQCEQTSHDLILTPRKPSGAAGSPILGNKLSSAPMFFGSSMQAYSGSVKTFSAEDIERATDKFDASRILGEGGFGLVYGGTVDDGRKVAVKILKREDQQGSREFLAEVEILGRLHHRNLVKLIGICMEDHHRCLVYELVPNGSVESHLHGADKADLLGWDARMKIALGAARALAYLHEDSSPCVIHRDFKSSNILLEHDCTPKVSDFGLARTAVDEGSKHISTHVMGTFGYLAPEYAMTGHLLVKSDVYSYGVVLLELLTGRKPVDLSQPPGQENLVVWARPLLTNKEGLEAIIDPVISSTTALDSVAKVAAIASMCVQPEVSHRPFMGEVVQALKLVCNEFDETKEEGLSLSQENLSMDMDRKSYSVSGELLKVSVTRDGIPSQDSCFGGQDLGTLGRHYRSGPLRTERRRGFWQGLRGGSRGSLSEHSLAFKLSLGSR